MGLDMYLEIRKNDYRSKYYKDKGCKIKLEYPKDITEFIPNPTDLRISRQTSTPKRRRTQERNILEKSATWKMRL